MQNPQIIKIIEDLKGRRDYEEKKATKLGFNSLYTYFENKLLQEKTALEESEKELEAAKDEAELLKKEKKEPKKTCGCC
jgi:flagellin-specific chaperone FliS